MKIATTQTTKTRPWRGQGVRQPPPFSRVAPSGRKRKIINTHLQRAGYDALGFFSRFKARPRNLERRRVPISVQIAKDRRPKTERGVRRRGLPVSSWNAMRCAVLTSVFRDVRSSVAYSPGASGCRNDHKITLWQRNLQSYFTVTKFARVGLASNSKASV